MGVKEQSINLVEQSKFSTSDLLGRDSSVNDY